MFFLAATLVGLAIVLYQQFIFHMAMRYTITFWGSYTLVLSLMFYNSPVPLSYGTIALGAIAICMLEIGLIHITRRMEAKSERNPPGSGPLPETNKSSRDESTWDRVG